MADREETSELQFPRESGKTTEAVFTCVVFGEGVDPVAGGYSSSRRRA